ncbi:MAG: bifunctional serine/threonine-protein kinase/formylglycine-generating enzyme family protein [Planctomycetota bacterium]
MSPRTEPDEDDPRETRDAELSAAEAALSAYLRQAREVSVDFRDFCRQHPELERALDGDGAPLPKAFWEGLLARHYATWVREDEPAANDVSARLEELRGQVVPGTRYVEQREIAHGGMGAIIEVWDRNLRRTLAMKSIRTAEEAGVRARWMQRFIDEAEVTSRLEHPGVVPIHELGVREDGRLYFTMPLVRGSDLQAVFEKVWTADPEWSRTRALGVIQRACEAVSYAHSRGVVHRDLKPANIMVGAFGETYVMDWGLARMNGVGVEAVTPDPPIEVPPDAASDFQRTRDGTVLGTPAFMSPEQAAGELERLDARTDVYAMGAVLYTLFARRPPYTQPGEEVTAAAVVARVRAGPPPRLESLAPDTPPELLSICERAMARPPDARYCTMVDMAADLRAFLEMRVVQAHRTGAWAELQKWVRRNRATAATLLLLALVISASAIAFGVYEHVTAAEIRRLADVRVVRALVAENEALWPPTPDRAAEFERWLARANDLIARGPLHRQRWQRIAPDRAAHTASDLATGVDASEGLAWEREVLGELIAGLDGLADRDAYRGPIPTMEARLRFAREVESRTITGPAAAERWSAAIHDIAVTPIYQGLRLEPQLGLLPLSKDPQSGLWEFWHVQSGLEPEPATDVRSPSRWRMTAETGLVLVLVPAPAGGAFIMGAQREGATESGGGHPSDPAARPDEQPPHAVALDPFFLSKYEMTQGQWLRIMGSNPSQFSPERHARSAGREHTLVNPVEQISHTDAVRALRRLALELPTEAQWEYAARANTTTLAWPGDLEDELRDCANLRDREWAEAQAEGRLIVDHTEVRDGYIAHAPVGSYPPNPFGLHEVLGNVWEWCADWYAPFTFPTAPGNGERMVPADEQKARVNRGGSFYSPPINARTAHRSSDTPGAVVNRLGVRPACPLQRR